MSRALREDPTAAIAVAQFCRPVDLLQLIEPMRFRVSSGDSEHPATAGSVRQLLEQDCLRPAVARVRILPFERKLSQKRRIRLVDGAGLHQSPGKHRIRLKDSQISE